jgi:hypothetical protein
VGRAFAEIIQASRAAKSLRSRFGTTETVAQHEWWASLSHAVSIKTPLSGDFFGVSFVNDVHLEK